MKNYQQFHDGFFEGLRTPEKGIVYVFLSTSAKERTTVVLSGVVMVKVTGFKEGKIIFDVVIRDHQEITLQDIAELYELQAGHEPAGWEQQFLEKSQQQGLKIFEINPSYGGACLILAQAVEFMKNERNVSDVA